MRISTIAFEHLYKCITNNDEIIGLRLYLVQKGCSGYAFDITQSLDRQKRDHEIVTYKQGNKQFDIFLNEAASKQESNIMIDYTDENLNNFLAVSIGADNRECGCGESFSM